jgi:hypothetical protein
MGISGLLDRVAEFVPPAEEKLIRWLRDVARRPNACMSFDLRGLSATHRAMFWDAVRAVNSTFLDWDQAANPSPTVGITRDLAAKNADGKLRYVVDDQIKSINLDELWGLD